MKNKQSIVHQSSFDVDLFENLEIQIYLTDFSEHSKLTYAALKLAYQQS